MKMKMAKMMAMAIAMKCIDPPRFAGCADVATSHQGAAVILEAILALHYTHLE
jgi:hypothetical protein